MNYPFTAKKVNSLGAMAMSVSAICGVLFGIWTVLDYSGFRPALIKELHEDEVNISSNFKTVQVQIDSLSQSALQLEWGILDAKLKQNGRLEPSELQRYCKLTRTLEYVQIQICGT